VTPTVHVGGSIQMLATGVRTDLGVKIFGPDLRTLADLALEVENILRPIPGAADLYSERVVGGRYLDITIDRKAAARFGTRVADIQMVVETAIGGMNLTTTVEGRERYPVRIRYASDYRSDPERIGRVLIPTAGGSQIPLEQVADISISAGPPMINSENGMLRSLVMLNVRDRDMGSFVDEAKAILAERQLPVDAPICIVPDSREAYGQLCQTLAGQPSPYAALRTQAPAQPHDLPPKESVPR